MKNTSKSARRSPPRDLTVHRDILLQHFNSLTCENQMKYELTEPEEGKFTFGDADLIVDFAKKMGVNCARTRLCGTCRRANGCSATARNPPRLS